MPFSSDSGKLLIDRVIGRLVAHMPNHEFRILDIGAGSGTYVNRYSAQLPKSKCTWHAVEVWEPYIDKYQLRDKYSDVYLKDARDFANALDTYYDIAFVGDVAEHMTKEEAQKLIGQLVENCGLVLMSIPIIHYPQGEYEGNPYEEHIKDDWSHDEVMASFDHIFDHGVAGEIGVYMLSKAPEPYQTLLRPKIGVYAVAKNEARFAARFAESIKDADAVVVADTGSTDATVQILKEHLTFRGKVVDLSVNPWRFDDARNSALMLLPPDLDLCISLDLDEYLQDGWHSILCQEIKTHLQTLGTTYDRYNHRFQTVWDWETIQDDKLSANTSSHWHERIHTRHGWKWKLPVHEVLVWCGDSQPTMAWLGGWTMTQKPETKASRGTYLPLLEQSVKEDPKIWKSWTFLAEEYAKANRIPDAVQALNRALALPDSDHSYINYRLGEVQIATDGPTALMAYQRAAQLRPHIREYWTYYAIAAKRLGATFEASMAIGKAKACLQPSNGYEHNAWCWGTGFDQLVVEILGANHE